MNTTNNTSGNNGDFEVMKQILGQAVELVHINASDFTLMKQSLSDTQSLVKGIVNKINANDDKLIGIDDRLLTLEESAEIKDEQAKTIIRIAKQRISELLGRNEYDIARYFRTFIGRLYAYLREYKGLGKSVATTQKRNYQNVLDGIDAWTPRGGIANLKSEVDRKAEAKLKAKQAGY